MRTLFKDLKVLELASVLAGPAAGMFFAELGAHVLKIENKSTGGDLTRQWKLPGEDQSSPVSAYYASVNWGKESLQLDLKDPADRARVYALVAESDLVITNFRKADALKLGMTYSEFIKYRPDIIQGNLSAYGEEDPRAGFDLVLQAEAGFMSMNGSPESGPLKMPVALIDVIAAHQLKEALLLALIQRMKTGKGTYVSVSLYEAALASLVNQAANYLSEGFVPQLAGSLHPNIAPYGEVLSTSDGKKIVLAIGNDKQFAALCKILGIPGLASDPGFQTNPARLKERKLLGIKLQEAAFEFNSRDLLDKIKAAGVPAGLIHNLAEVFAGKEARPMILTESREGREFRIVSSLAFQESRGFGE